MKTFSHSGKCGDVIFSLPTIKAMGGGKLLLPETGIQGSKLFSNLYSLLIRQPYITAVERVPDVEDRSTGIQADIDLDLHFTHRLRGKVNMVQRYFDVFNINGVEYKQPWLDMGVTEMDYTVVNLTPRFRDNSTVDWKRVMQGISGQVYFVGTKEEHEYFSSNICAIQWIETKDVYTLAMVIAGAKAVYCNQSLVLALSAGMDKKRYVQFKPRKTNCRFYTPNEYELL